MEYLIQLCSGKQVKNLMLVFDLAFMNERVAVSFDMYKSKTSKMLVYEELAAPSGFKNVATNDGQYAKHRMGNISECSGDQ
jgi:hypothetical protein